MVQDVSSYRKSPRTTLSYFPQSDSPMNGCGQDRVASPVFLAWSKQDCAGHCLDMALSSLVPTALRALDVTDRPVPSRLAGLEAEVREIVPDLAQPRAFGPVVASITEALGRETYPS